MEGEDEGADGRDLLILIDITALSTAYLIISIIASTNQPISTLDNTVQIEETQLPPHHFRCCV